MSRVLVILLGIYLVFLLKWKMRAPLHTTLSGFLAEATTTANPLNGFVGSVDEANEAIASARTSSPTSSPVNGTLHFPIRSCLQIMTADTCFGSFEHMYSLRAHL